MRPPRRRGYTLLEILIAVSIAAVILYVVFALMMSGFRMSVLGTATARGPEAELILLDRLERDLLQCLQIPGDPRPPAVIDAEGTRISFYRPDPEASGLNAVVGVPATWALAPAAGGDFHPVRDGRTIAGVTLRRWELTLLEPDEAEKRFGWFVVVRVTFPSGNRLRPDFTTSRLVPLPQPSSNYRFFPTHGADLPTGLVRLPGGPAGDSAFASLGPPRSAVPQSGGEVP